MTPGAAPAGVRARETRGRLERWSGGVRSGTGLVSGTGAGRVEPFKTLAGWLARNRSRGATIAGAEPGRVEPFGTLAGWLARDRSRGATIAGAARR